MCIRVWSFAEKLEIPRFQNATMRRLLSLLSKKYIRAENVDLAFRLSSPDSVLRTVVFRCFLRDADPTKLNDNFGSLKYGESDIECLSYTPGGMVQFLTLLSRLGCKNYPCYCRDNCYWVREDEFLDFMVQE